MRRLLSILTAISIIGLAGCTMNETISNTSINSTSIIETTTPVIGDGESVEETTKDTYEPLPAIECNYTVENIVKSINPKNFKMKIQHKYLTMESIVNNDNVKTSYSVYMTHDTLKDAIDDGKIIGCYNMDKIEENGGITFNCTIYQVNDKVYFYSNIIGVDEYYQITDNDSVNATSFFDDSIIEKINEDNIKTVEYIESIEYNLVDVDVVKVTTIADEVFNMYINSNTGSAVAISVLDGSGDELSIDIDSDKIEINKEFENCSYCKSNKISEYIMSITMFPMLIPDVQS